jgi:class 3 adenylate cyclase/tetratricopeptide (TPR) repeat protein
MNNSRDEIKKAVLILVSDIKSFTKKMNRDERAAFELLRMYDAIMRGLVVQFGGTVVKMYGDYFTVQFSDPVEALKCAIEIQKRFWSFNLGKMDYESIEVRIGLHADAGDLNQTATGGEGIEIASRIESLTDVNRICISGNVYSLVKGKVAFQAFSIGNIERADGGGELSVYEVLFESIAEYARPSERAHRKLTKDILKELYKQGDEEATEAKALEEVKEQYIRNRLETENLVQEIEESYRRADLSYKAGSIEDAEKEIRKIYKLYPHYEDAEDRKQEEEEKEKRAEARIVRAREHLEVGDYENAETEINRVFHVFPLHLEAQRVAQEIEDKRAEEQCIPRMTKARSLFLKGNLDEAESEIKEIFNVLPNHANAQLLSRQIEAARQKLKEEERERRVEESINRAKAEKNQLIQAILDKSRKDAEILPPRTVSAPVNKIPEEPAPQIPTPRVEEKKLPPEKTEEEIAAIKNLFPNYRDPVERHQEEEAKKIQTEEHFLKAQAFFQQGDLDCAEKEIHDLFHFSPLHAGAQQILQQIEDARYERENQERSKKIEKTKRKESTEEDKYAEELLNKARALLEAGEFTEVMFTLHDLFNVNPNHAGARQLKEDLQKAKEERAARRRDEAIQKEAEAIQNEEEQQRFVRTAVPRKIPVQQRPRIVKKPEPQPPQKKYTTLVRLVLVCIIGSVLGIAGWQAFKYFFPKTVSIAVLNYTPVDRDTLEVGIAEVLSAFLKDDFARCTHVTTVASTSPAALDPKTIIFAERGTKFNVQYFLTGDIQRQGNQYTITTTLVNASTHRTEYKLAFNGDVTALPRFRSAIIRSILQHLEIESPLPDIPSISCSPEGYQKYLSAYGLIQRATLSSLSSAISFLRQCIEKNNNFIAAEVLLARAEINSYALGDEDEQVLGEAVDHAKRGLNSPADAAEALRIIGESSLFNQQFDLVLKNVKASLQLQPANGQSYRDLSRAYIGMGDYDAAFQNASRALKLEPVNGESYLLLGMIKYFQKEFRVAAEYYQQAIQYGMNDSLVTSQYLAPVWNILNQSEKEVNFWKNQLSRWPDNYRAYYYIGRAYQKAINIPISEQTALYNESFVEGLRAAHLALQVNPAEPYAHAYNALICSRIGSFQDGNEEIQKALEFDSSSAKIHYLAAEVFCIQKDVPRALAALKQAVALKYDLPELFNPDLTRIKDEPEFINIITKPH